MNRHSLQSSKILLLIACVLLHTGAANVSARADGTRPAHNHHSAPFGELIVKVQRLIERREIDPLSNLRVVLVPTHVKLNRTFAPQATITTSYQARDPLSILSRREALYLLKKYGQAP